MITTTPYWIWSFFVGHNTNKRYRVFLCVAVIFCFLLFSCLRFICCIEQIICNGYEACMGSTINDVEDMTCWGELSCANSRINGISRILTVYGKNALSGGSIYSRSNEIDSYQLIIIMNTTITSSSSTYIHCTGNDICKINCVDTDSCKYVVLSGTGTFYVICDTNTHNCPDGVYKIWTTDSPTSMPIAIGDPSMTPTQTNPQTTLHLTQVTTHETTNNSSSTARENDAAFTYPNIIIIIGVVAIAIFLICVAIICKKMRDTRLNKAVEALSDDNDHDQVKLQNDEHNFVNELFASPKPSAPDFSHIFSGAKKKTRDGEDSDAIKSGLLASGSGDNNANIINVNDDGKEDMDELQYQLWTQNQVSQWLKQHLEQKFESKTIKSFLKEFDNKFVSGSYLKEMKNDSDSIDHFRAQFSRKNQADGIWAVVRPAIINVGNRINLEGLAIEGSREQGVALADTS